MTQKQLILLSLFLLFILILRFIFVFRFENKIKIKEGDYITFTSIIYQEPRTSGSYQFFKNEVGGNEMGVLAPAFPDLHYGDKIKISGKISTENFQLPNQNEDKNLIMYFPKIEIIGASGFLSGVSFIRQRLITSFSTVLPATNSSLLLGIVFGIKDSMPKEFLNQLKITGVMHVIAASGMNVTMIAGFLTSLTVLFFKRKAALFISIAGILFYSALAGFQPSIIRASIMAIIVFSAQILGRQTLASYSLYLTAFLMLFLNPRQISDVGFQLSFLSTAGILYIQPLFSRFESFKKSFLGDSIITTFSAQVSTLPILLLNFGTYSIWSIVVNALVLWTVLPLMVLGGFAGIFSFIFAPISRLILFICLPFLVYFEKIAAFFSDLPGYIQLTSFPPSFVLGYYFILSPLLIYLRKNYISQ